jgi:hypothetical protein
VGVLISPIVLTRRDVQGNEFVDLYSIYEYRDAGIQPTGEAIDLSNFMRRVENIHAQPVSGVLLYEPRPNATDFPGNAGSGRMELYYLGSGVLQISGLAITIVSGHPFLISGFIGPVSGRIAVQGNVNAGLAMTPVLSGTAVSGARAYIHAFGF